MYNKTIFTIMALLVSLTIFSQSISPSTANEYCPSPTQSTTQFTVTLPVAVDLNIATPVSVLAKNGMWATPVVSHDAYNVQSNGSSTTFNFDGFFRDINANQTYTVSYTYVDASTGNDKTLTYDFVFSKIKSFMYPDPNSNHVDMPHPSQTSLNTKWGTVVNIPISFNEVLYVNFEKSSSGTPFTFGSGMSHTYMYNIPVGWKLNGIVCPSSGYWFQAGKSVTITSDLCTGDGQSIAIRAMSDCSPNSSYLLGPITYIPITRTVPTVSISPTNFNTALCNGQTITETLNGFQNFPATVNPTVTWSSSTGLVTLNSTAPNYNITTITANSGSGNTVITATLNALCLANPIVNSVSLFVGSANTSINPAGFVKQIPPSINGMVHIVDADPNATYKWTVNNQVQTSKGSIVSFLVPDCVGGLLYQNYTISVNATNNCGSTNSCGIFRYSCGNGTHVGSLNYTTPCITQPCVQSKLHPQPCPPPAPLPVPRQINRFLVFQDGDNPTNLEIILDNTSSDEFAKLNFNVSDLSVEQLKYVKLFDVEGNLILENDDIADKQIEIDMSGFDEGSYYVQIGGNNDYNEQQNFKYSVIKTDTKLAEEIANGDVSINTGDATDRKEVLKQQLYKELRGNYDLLNSSDLLQQFFASQKVDDIGKINDINEALAKYDIPTAEGLMIGWQPTTRQSLNCLQYYTYFISYLGGYTFSQQDIDALYALANSCPDVDGEIVFAARSLYNYVTQLDEDFSNACTGYASRGTKKVKSQAKAIVEKVTIYPNPSNGNFSIKFPTGYKGVNTVKVLDQTGKVILQKTVISGVQNFSLSQGLANGVYTVQITNSVTNKTENQKLIVNK